MECERLTRLVKSWYLQVKDEALAPARMVDFMEKHIAECPVCLVDDEVRGEVNRITRIILPPSKMPKAKQEEAAAAREAAEAAAAAAQAPEAEGEIEDEEDEL